MPLIYKMELRQNVIGKYVDREELDLMKDLLYNFDFYKNVASAKEIEMFIGYVIDYLEYYLENNKQNYLALEPQYQKKVDKIVSYLSYIKHYLNIN